MTSIVLFVPGLLGSELIDDQGKVWPGSLWNGIVGFNEQRFQRLLAPMVDPARWPSAGIGGTDGAENGH
jgi:hypothetical protein